VTHPTYRLPLYPFYYIFSFTHLFYFSIRPTFLFLNFIFSILYCPSSICSFYQRDKLAKPGNISKSKALLENRERWKEGYFHFFAVSWTLTHSAVLMKSSPIRGCNSLTL
jgi:hypothetical protein